MVLAHIFHFSGISCPRLKEKPSTTEQHFGPWRGVWGVHELAETGGEKKGVGGGERRLMWVRVFISVRHCDNNGFK